MLHCQKRKKYYRACVIFRKKFGVILLHSMQELSHIEVRDFTRACEITTLNLVNEPYAVMSLLLKWVKIVPMLNVVSLPMLVKSQGVCYKFKLMRRFTFTL